MKKTIAIVTSMFFLFTTVFNGVSYANINTGNIMKMPEQEPFFSPVLGKITSSKYYDSDEIVINIQDLHCHAQTQRQISSILELLEKKYGINGVYLEGTYKEVNTSWLSGFNDGKQGSAIIEKMVEDGRLSGTEYYSLMNNKRDFIKPIEDEHLYKENIKLLNEIITNNQEVEIICNELEEQINSIKKSYSSDKAMKFEKLIKDFEAKKIDSRKYYQGLAKYAKEKNIDITKYANVELYIKLMENNGGLNESKVAGELGKFLAEIKNKLSYQEYANLLRKSDNFAKAENITDELVSLNNQYQITKNLKLRNLESFINYLEFNNKINPVSFLEEEKSLREEIFTKLGRTKYEQEVSFLSDFVSNIREYFTANISAQEYYRFEGEYKKFRTTWPSYFSVNTVKKLDKYQELLNKYHGNNIKRDKEFAKRIITKSNEKGTLIAKETKSAIDEIAKNIKNKNVKVVVTGGFHTRGLEKILEANKISYAIITPKITGSIEQAKQIYWNTIIYNATILKNTINLEPISQEAIDISFPKIMASVFEIAEQNLKNKNIKKDIEEFIDKNVIQKQSKSDKTEIVNWEIEGEIKADKTVYRVTYKDNADNGRLSEKEYIYSNGETVAFSAINTEKTKQMLQKSKGREYAGPAILLEPGKSVRKQINKYVLEPLKSVSDGIFSFMDYEKLHMTVGYEPNLTSDFTEEELNKIKSLIGTPLQKTTFEGTLKLMPDGVIIYEIKDAGLVEQMYKLRDKLTQNTSYATPSIVHMTIGRITDTSLLKNTPESKEKLAEILRKINEKIYEINKADKLSKIKIQNTVIYVSSAKERQVITQKAEPLSILKDLFKNTNKKLNLFSVTVFQPIAEEIVFRILPSIPLLITSFAITTNPALIIPAILTAITGTFIFSYSHTLADKITNKEQVRDWKSLLPKSILLTGVYLGLLILFPEQIILAPIVTIILHSLNNIASVITKDVAPLNIIEPADKKDNAESQSIPVIEQPLVDNLIEQLSNLSSSGYTGLDKIKENLLNLPEEKNKRYDTFIAQLYMLTNILRRYSVNRYNEKELYFEDYFISTFVPFLTLPNTIDSGRMFFYTFIDLLFEETAELDLDAKIIKDILTETSSVVAKAYSINPDFVPYIVKKLVSGEKEFIKKGEEDHSVNKNLKGAGFDALKSYFFSFPSDKKRLSKVFIDKAKVINNKIKPLISDERSRKNIGDIVGVLEEMAYKFNDYNRPLLEIALNDLIKEALKLQKTDKKLCIEIIEIALAVSAQALLETQDMNSEELKIREQLQTFLFEECKNNPDSMELKSIIRMLLHMLERNTPDISESVKKDVTELILDILSQIYKSVISDDKKSFASKKRYQYIVFVLKNLASKRPNDDIVFDYVFNNKKNLKENNSRIGLGFTLDSLEILKKAAKADDRVKEIPVVSNEQLISDDINKLSDKIVDNINYLNPFPIIEHSYISAYNKKERDLIVQILDKLSKLAKDKIADKEKRKSALYLFSDILANNKLYSSIDKSLLLDFDQIKTIASEIKAPLYLLPRNISINHIEKKEGKETKVTEYTFTPLMAFIPKKIFEDNPLTSDNNSTNLLNIDPPVLTKITGKTNIAKDSVKQMYTYFETLQEILSDNVSALTALQNLDQNLPLEKYLKNLSITIAEIQKMIDGLKRLNRKYDIHHGKDAQVVLDQIKKLGEDNIGKNHKELDSWKADDILKIQTLHTLINAVHQTSIADFKDVVKRQDIDLNNIKTITAKQTTDITCYNLSDRVNSNIVKFISKLASIKFPAKEMSDIFCKDELIIWTTMLNSHSVDIFFNFGEADRGISVYYREEPSSVEDIGKRERVRYFEEMLKYLGFHVEHKEDKFAGERSYGFVALLNKDYGLNESMDLIDIASHVAEVFKFSINLDLDLTQISKIRSDNVYKGIFEGWLKKAKRREAWYGVDVIVQGDYASEYGQNGINLTALPKKRSLSVDSLNAILSYLGCDLLPENTAEEQLQDPTFLNKYFNKPIETAYAEGKIILNEESVLVKNENFNVIQSMMEEITTNYEETSIISKIINLLNNYEFNTKILANVGAFVVISSIMPLTNGDKLFVKGIMDPKTRRTKFAVAEKVSFSGRKKLTEGELIELLKPEGYDIPKQKWEEDRERKKIKKLLSRRLQNIESPVIPSNPISVGKGFSIVGEVVFDKKDVNETTIFVKPYTTPDDMDTIKKAKGIVTTGGGVLSHAAITTRELHKPAVVFNNAVWSNNEVDVLYHSASGDIRKVNRNFPVQEIRTNRKILKKGTRILINGETGMALLFDDMDKSLLDELQKYINENDEDNFVSFMTEHANNTNINRLVEYVYFQVIGNQNTTKILSSLFSKEMPKNIKEKINELNDDYIQNKIEIISNAVKNLKGTDNPNIASNIIEELNKNFAVIKTTKKIKELESLKKQVQDIEKNNKKNLNLFMIGFINKTATLLEKKEELNIEDIQEIISMITNVEIYDYFVSEDETSKELLEKKEIIQQNISLLKEKLNNYMKSQTDLENLEEEISLFEDKAGNEKKFGSKTAQLAKIYKLLNNKKGVIVPNGMGISVNVMPMLFKALGKENLLTDFENAIKDKDKEKAKILSALISEIIDSKDFAKIDKKRGISDRLNTFVEKNKTYSVRSSGVGEDSANNAFAGMGETKLNIKKDDIFENLKECWKSFFSERCIDYMIASGQIVKPAALVEEMVDSEKAGVIFSRDNYGNGTINVVLGQGEGIASGKYTPDNILFDMDSGEITEYSVANKQYKLVPDRRGGLKQETVGQEAKTRALNSENVKKLAEVTKILEKDAGYPVDIEFAVKGDDIYILQRRAITTIDRKDTDLSSNNDKKTKVGSLTISEGKVNKYRLPLTTLIMPIVEETFFRILPSIPLLITSFAITTNPALIIPAILTAITGTFIFSYSHTLADKITNKEQVRGWKSLLPKSILLTGVYLGLLILFPEQIILAPIVTIILHSLNNIASVITKKNITVLDIIDNNDTDSSVPVIEQSLVDKLVSDISEKFSLEKYKGLKEITQQLLNLPEGIAERYDAFIEQIYILIEILKKYSETSYSPLATFGEEFIEIFVPFLTLTDKKGSNKMLFYSLVDSLFTNVGRRYNIMAESFALMKISYSLNPDFVPYVVKKLISEKILNLEAGINRYENALKMGGDKLEKQFFLAVASTKELNKNLSQILKENIDVINKDIKPLITDEKNKQDVNDITSVLEELSDKINIESLPLLEKELNSLFEKAIELKDTDKNLSLQIIKTVLSISAQVLSETKDMSTKKINIRNIKPLLLEEYNSNPNSEIFRELVSLLMLMVQQEKNDGLDSFTKEVADILLNVALQIYEPISKNKIEDVNSEEYKNRKQQCLEIFSELASRRIDDNKIFDVLFHKGFVYSVEGKNGPGLTTDTLNILINAAEQNDMVMDLPVPTEEAFISEDIEGLSDKVVDGINNLNPLEFIKSALSTLKDYSSKRKKTDVKARQLSIQIIEKLFDLAKSQDTEKKNTKKRKRAVSVLFDVAAEGIYHDTFKELSLDLDQIRNLALQFNLPLYLYPGDVSIENTSRKESYSEYSFTPLLKYLPALVTDQENPLTFREEKNLQTQETSVVKDIISLDSLNIKSPIITKITGKTDETREDVKQVLHRFEVLQKILEYNTSVLALLDSLKDSKKQEANMKALLKELKKMVEKLKEINEQHGNDAEFALNNIEKSLKEAILTDRDNIFRRHLLIDLWNDQTIREIKSVHTLINAIHQTAIADFKQEVGNVSSAGRAKAIQTITAKQKSTISGHNLSEEVNPNVVKFMNKLASRKFALDRIDDFVCKDELVVWTTKLNAHSVDILFNFGDTDRGIDIRYRERPVAQENLGKKERIRYFGEILEYLGFHVDKETQRSNGTESYILAAKLNKDFGLNDSMDLVDIAARVVEIFKFSTNVDFDLRTIKRTKSEEEYNEIFKQWLTKAKRKESWYGVASNDGDGTRNVYGYGIGGKDLGVLPDKRILNVDSLNNILDYLGCDLLPEGTTAEQLKDPRFLDKYFNRPIERAYVEGRIVVNENSVLVQKEEDIIFPIINEITGNNLEATLKSKIVNLVNGYDFNTKILANIGKYLFVSSIMNLKNGDKLFVKGIMNFNTKRMIYTIAERVGTTTRQNLASEQLRQLLNNEGYDIPKPDQGKSRERKRRKELLLREIQRIESPNIPCMSTSEGTGVSVVGNITFNKDNVDENSILVVPFTSPDDVGYIEKAKGIITTGGGILSHAAITTREMQKPSVILNGAAWNENELEIFYNWASGDTDIIHYGKDTYHIQKVKTKTKQLKEGTRVLMNGETGMVLLFDDIDNSLLDEIQQYIDSDNAVAVSKFMKEHCKDENINRFAEYIYFQVAGNPNTPKTLNTFLSEDMPEEVKDKIKELNDGYVQDKIQSISEAIENVKSISNVNIIYNMHNELNKKMQIIRTIGDNKKIKTLKEQIRDIEKDNKKKLNYFMQTFINDSNNLIKKDNLSDDDIQNAILKIKLAEVYNYFANEAETDKLMLEKKKIIRNLIPKLRDKVNSSEIKDAALDLNKEVSLFEENAGNEKLFGSKTAQLAKMYKILSDIEGVTVPNGMGISVNILPMLFKTVGKENLLTDFEEAIKNKDEQKAKVLSKKICDLIDSKEFTGTELENGIKQRLSTFLRPGKKYSVRSSGVGEDATNNAFAGMGETKLNVKDEDIYENIKECWKSFFSERCIEYMISSGQIVKPAVLVQEMVNSEISGVVFSRNKYGNGTINAVLGQGEGIVSGMYSPDSILFDMSTGRVGEIIEYSVATKPFKIVTNPNGGVEQVAVGKNSKARALNTKQVKIIGEITKKLERYTNYPIDVEFSIEGDELYILQMRPITTLSAKNKEQSSDIEIPVIEQSVIDKTINLLSYWKENAKKAIKPIKDLKAFENIITQLSNLPEDSEQRYYAIVEQIYNLLDLLKKEHVGSVLNEDNPSIIFSETADEFGKFCSEKNLGGDSSWNKDIVSFSDFIPYLLAPFFNIKDIKNPEKTLFNSIVDYWFVESKDRGEDVVLEEMATLIKCVHSVNPEYIPYIVDKLIEYEYISPEEQIDVKVSNKIGKSYDVLKEYYFAISSKEKVNKDLSKELKNAVKNIKRGLKEFTLNEQQQQKVTLSLSRLEEFSDKINDKNIPLMKNLINDLWDILSKENKEQTVIYMLPLLVCFAKGGKLADYFCIELKTDTIFKVLRSSYNVNSDNKLFYYILDELFDILRQLYVFDSENGNRKLSSEIAGNLLLALYAPIYENTLDINSSEYKEREKTFYTIFEKLTSEFPDNLNVFGYLLASSGKLIPETRNINEKYIFGPGLNKKTLQMYVNTVRKSDNRKIFVILPVKDSDIRDIDELVNLFIDNFDLFNLTSLCNDLLTKKENGKKLAVAIVERLLEKIENKNIDPKEKQKILFMLVSMAISELYMSMQEYNFFDIDKLNELCKEYNLSYYLKSVTDSYVEFGKKTSTKGDYRLINLLKYLPKDMFGLNVVQEPPIIYRFNGETKNNDEKVEMTRKKFNTLQQALNDNTLALSLLDGLSKSKTPEKDMNELIDILSGMIKALSLINEEHGTAAQTALGNIVKTLYTQETFNWKNKNGKLNLNRIRQQLEIKTWKAEDLSKITEIHTLINAVHQTTISDFKDTIEDITDSNAIKTISATHQNTQYHSEHPEKTGIKIYDLSENEINPDIVNFIGKLSLMNLPYPRTDETKPYYQINDFVCMDNFLVWTTRLYIHSVDIFINFAESDKTITIAFHESGNTTSNADRVKYFSAILKNLGFSVEANTETYTDTPCSLKAKISSNYGLSDDTDFVDVATKVISLFKYSDLLDFELAKYAKEGGSSYENTFNNLINKFMLGDIWYGYHPSKFAGWNDASLTAIPERWSLSSSEIKKILEYLGLATDNISYKINQNDLNKYFNYAIERAFAVGRIVLKDGIMVKNEDYDVISYLAKEISLNEEEAINKSELINFIPRNKFNFKTVGYIGDLIAVSGYLKLKDGNYLAVKGLINPATKRMDYSNVELVTFDGRKVVNADELSTILKEEGFDVSNREKISNTEQNRMKNLLHRQVQVTDTPEMRGIPTSSGNGTYVAGYITFNKNNVNENSVFVAPYTTPDDVESIKNAKAIITTSGGVLSHAAITTREYQKPSAIINGVNWHDDTLDVLYYSSTGEPFSSESLNIRKISERTKNLKEGSIVLLNGETGHILLFDDVDDKILKKLQTAIEKDDADKIKQIFVDNINNENIKKLVEYVYFQTIGDSRMPNTLNLLFSSDIPQVITDKIKELNEGYIQDKIIKINEAIENLKNIDNPNIAYSLIQMLTEKLAFIKTSETRKEIDTLKDKVIEKAEEVKDKLFAFLTALDKECKELNSKENLTQQDVNRIINIIQQANVYNMFVAENEERTELKNIKGQLKGDIELLEAKVKKYIESKNKAEKQMLSLDDINLDDVYMFGSKTTELAVIKKLLQGKENIVVPEGVGINNNTFELFFEKTGQKEKFSILSNSFEQAIRDGNSELAQEFAQQIGELIEAGKTEYKKTYELQRELSDIVLKTLGDTKYSVRSSGVGEDSANNAFAGMGETLLNVSKNNLFESLLTCWQSFYSERSIEYMINSKQIVRPAVLIQTMIDVEKAGVAFSRDKYGNATVETLYGLGEGIVSGKLTPDTITANMANGDVLEYSVATKNYKIVPSEDGVKTAFVGKGEKDRTLNYKEIKELIDVVKILEKSAGYAVDIEFGFKDGKIFILQRRPITTTVNNTTTEQKDIKCSIQLSLGYVQEEQEVFVNIKNPLNEEESVPVYFEMEKTADGYSYNYIVDPQYASIIDLIREELVVRSNEDNVIKNKLNENLSVFAQAKEGEFEILPPLSDMLDPATIEQNINVNINGIRNLLASA